MPFDPNIVRPECPPLNDSGDLELPDDLDELAAQLGDDAKFLANTYPASSLGLQPRASIEIDEPVSPQKVTPGTGVPGYARAVALVSSVAAIITIAVLWYPRENSREIAPRNVAVVPGELTSPDPTNTTVGAVQPPENVSTVVPPTTIKPELPTAPPAPASRDTFLHEYSGPELEGLYDLIGDSEDDKISI